MKKELVVLIAMIFIISLMAITLPSKDRKRDIKDLAIVFFYGAMVIILFFNGFISVYSYLFFSDIIVGDWKLFSPYLMSTNLFAMIFMFFSPFFGNTTPSYRTSRNNYLLPLFCFIYYIYVWTYYFSAFPIIGAPERPAIVFGQEFNPTIATVLLNINIFGSVMYTIIYAQAARPKQVDS